MSQITTRVNTGHGTFYIRSKSYIVPVVKEIRQNKGIPLTSPRAEAIRSP